MRRLALLIPLLVACSSKPQPQTTPAEDDTAEEDTAEAEPVETGGCADPDCYADCIADGGETADCEASCCATEDGGDATEVEICMDECMSNEGADPDECEGYCNL